MPDLSTVAPEDAGSSLNGGGARPPRRGSGASVGFTRSDPDQPSWNELGEGSDASSDGIDEGRERSSDDSSSGENGSPARGRSRRVEENSRLRLAFGAGGGSGCKGSGIG